MEFKHILTTLLILVSTYSLSSQVGINTNGANPDPSAMLDVKSTNKGMLIPRMTSTERQTIQNPAQGLMVYDQTANAFYYFNGIGWLELLNGTVKELKDANGDTKIQVEETVDDDIIRFDIEGVERIKLEQNRIEVVNNDDNIFLGDDSGNVSYSGTNNIGLGTTTLDSITSGNHNIAIGKDAMRSSKDAEGNFAAGYESMFNDIDGRNNVAIGIQTLYNSTSGRDNVALGYYVLYENTTGKHNVGLGNFAFRNNTTGIQNMGIGNFALSSNISGDNNSALGNFSMSSNTTGDNNVALGNNSLGNNTEGSMNTGLGSYTSVLSDNLRKATAIGSHAEVGCDNCLVLGEADSIRVGIGTNFPDEKLHIEGNLKLIDGNQQDGYVLTSNTDGVGSWQSLGSITDNQTLSLSGQELSIVDGNTVNIKQSSISDSDDDTKIEVEQGMDDDIIRLSVAGTEKLTVKNVGNSNSTQLAFANSSNTLIGNGVGENLTDGFGNTSIGDNTLNLNESGFFNTTLGSYALSNNKDGDRNIAIGASTLHFNDNGSDNIAIGNATGFTNENGSQNILIGNQAGYGANLHNKNNNVMIGFAAGESNDGNGNIFLGFNAGQNSSASNRLFIENSNSNSPLIYGEFDNNIVRINGDLKVTGDFPISSLLSDNDNDTKIELEENSDEDIIRIDIAGDEKWQMANNTIIPMNDGNGIFIGQNAGANDMLTFDGGEGPEPTNNIFLGENAGSSNTTGVANIALGKSALSDNDDGQNNISLGSFSLRQNTSGNNNIAFGDSSLDDNTSGSNNISIGGRALSRNLIGESNIALGKEAIWQNLNGANNIAIGEAAGGGNIPHSKSNSIYIGHKAGNLNQGNKNIFIGAEVASSNTWINSTERLAIDVEDNDNPLLYGEFDNNLIKINGDLEVTGTFPGSDDQLIDSLTLDGSILKISLENDGEAAKNIDLSTIDTDNQSIDVLSLNGTTLEISLEDDGVMTQTLDLSAIDTNTDDQTIDYMVINGNGELEISLENDGEAPKKISLTSIDTDTDDQSIDVLNLDGTTLEISLEDDGVAIQTVDLSAIDTDTDDQTIDYMVLNANGELEISLEDDGEAPKTIDLSTIGVPIGSIMMWYTETPPTGWLICEGSNVPAQYTQLIGIIGNQLPDLEGRFVLGAGERNEGSNHPLLSSGGIETVELQEANIPEHNHDVTIGFREGEEQGSGNDYSDLGASGSDQNASRTYTTDDWGGSSNGQTLPHQNMPPFLTLHYIIKAE